MSYRLRHEESASRGLRRLARKALRSARDELARHSPPSDNAIHEARKSIKKTRAIVDLIDEDDGRRIRRSRRALRRVNRILSELRDADAMLEILDSLRKKNPRLFSEHTFARIQRELRAHKRRAMERAGRHDAWKELDRRLRVIRREAGHWQPAHRGFRTIAAGLRATLRRGRKALERARRSRRAADFHEWRKQMKALWYELRLLERCGPIVRRDLAPLHAAETALGDEHNLVVLCEQLAEDASVCASPADRARLRRAAARAQRELRDKAIASAGRIYARKPGEYVRKIRRAWRAWRRQPTAARRDSRRYSRRTPRRG